MTDAARAGKPARATPQGRSSGTGPNFGRPKICPARGPSGSRRMPAAWGRSPACRPAKAGSALAGHGQALIDRGRGSRVRSTGSAGRRPLTRGPCRSNDRSPVEAGGPATAGFGRPKPGRPEDFGRPKLRHGPIFGRPKSRAQKPSRRVRSRSGVPAGRRAPTSGIGLPRTTRAALASAASRSSTSRAASGSGPPPASRAPPPCRVEVGVVDGEIEAGGLQGAGQGHERAAAQIVGPGLEGEAQEQDRAGRRAAGGDGLGQPGAVPGVARGRGGQQRGAVPGGLGQGLQGREVLRQAGAAERHAGAQVGRAQVEHGIGQ